MRPVRSGARFAGRPEFLLQPFLARREIPNNPNSCYRAFPVVSLPYVSFLFRCLSGLRPKLSDWATILIHFALHYSLCASRALGESRQFALHPRTYEDRPRKSKSLRRGASLRRLLVKSLGFFASIVSQDG